MCEWNRQRARDYERMGKHIIKNNNNNNNSNNNKESKKKGIKAMEIKICIKERKLILYQKQKEKKPCAPAHCCAGGLPARSAI
jgi:hypothetical protein